MARPELRPLGVGEIIDAAIKLVTGNARVLFTIAAVVLVPLGVLQLLLYAALGGVGLLDLFDNAALDTVVTEQEADALIDAGLQFLALAGGLAVIAGIGSVLVQGATVKAASDVYQGTQPEWQDSLRAGLRRLVPILVAVIAVAIGSGLGLILCLLPGVWLFTSWTVTIPAVVVESRGPFAAMSRSFQLVRPRFGPTLGVVVLSYLIYGAATYLINALGSLLTFFAEPSSGVALTASLVSSTVASIVVLPFIAAVLIVLYFDLRVRAEGYDLEVMARELGETPHYLPPPPDDPQDPFGLGPAGGG